jgi:hypothetical protein
MRNFSYLGSLAALLAAAPLAQANGGGDDSAQAIVAKAIKAHGGEEKLSQWKAVTLKGAGTIHIAGESFKFDAVWSLQGTTQQKFAVDVTINGMLIKVTKVVNGDKGWQKVGDGQATPLTKDEVADEKHGMYANHLQQLVPLKHKMFTLAPLGEVKVNDKDAVGVSVSCKGHTDVSLYFDKKTHLLVKAETRIKDQGNEINEETFFSEYKAVDGIMQPFKLLIMRDGKKFVEGDLTEIQIHTQKLDDSIFGPP